MHVIRDWAARQQSPQQEKSVISTRSRRISIQDAVYLTAHVMLPLLQRMHSVGIVHRDVKPSNVVKRAGTSISKDFSIVDFGLSKSIVVPGDSSMADPEHTWPGSQWMKTTSAATNDDTISNPTAHYRKEREIADFRGTSMYASVRVHQLKDYCPRDDIWSLMYVFCDLVSGGLPWMSHAANRDRKACQELKERIHGMETRGDGESSSDTKQLLMGDEYHQALYKKSKADANDTSQADANNADLVPPPLELSNDKAKVQCLEAAFEHLKQLNFFDMPNYDLIRQCLEKFLDESEGDASAHLSSPPPIDWEALSAHFQNRRAETTPFETDTPLFVGNLPSWNSRHASDHDPLQKEGASIFVEADRTSQNSTAEEEQGATLYGVEADMARLPFEMRFRIAQMDYNTLHYSTIEPHLALHDWMRVVLPLLYGSWDSSQYEKGGHRVYNDGYRRECFLLVVEKCLECSTRFKGFCSKECFYQLSSDDRQGWKRRKVDVTIPGPTNQSGGIDMTVVSKVIFELSMAKKMEERLPRAPPPLLSFGA